MIKTENEIASELEAVRKDLAAVKKESKRKNLDLQDMRKEISDKRLEFECRLEDTKKKL